MTGKSSTKNRSLPDGHMSGVLKIGILPPKPPIFPGFQTGIDKTDCLSVHAVSPMIGSKSPIVRGWNKELDPAWTAVRVARM